MPHKKLLSRLIIGVLFFVIVIESAWLFFPGIKKTNHNQVIEVSGEKMIADVNNVYKTSDPLKAWIYFKQKYKTENPARHDVAHYIGNLLYNSYDIDALKYCDMSYTFGCFHGVLEKHMASKGLGGLGQVIDYCDTLPKYEREVVCYHGLGHGIAPYFKYNLKKATIYCGKLLANESEKNNCIAGVSMEFAQNNYMHAKKDDPLWPCNTSSESENQYCYGYQRAYLFFLYEDDIKTIFNACSQAKDKDNAYACMAGVGNGIGNSDIGNVKRIVNLCSLAGTDEYKFDCITNAASAYIFNGKSYEETIQIFCTPMPSHWSSYCNTKLKKLNNYQNNLL